MKSFTAFIFLQVQLLTQKLMRGAALLICLAPAVVHAQNTGGLDSTISILETLREYAFLAIPVICLISGGVAGLCYSMDIIRKETLWAWLGGTIFAGLIAGAVVSLVF